MATKGFLGRIKKIERQLDIIPSASSALDRIWQERWEFFQQQPIEWQIEYLSKMLKAIGEDELYPERENVIDGLKRQIEELTANILTQNKIDGGL